MLFFAIVKLKGSTCILARRTQLVVRVGPCFAWSNFSNFVNCTAFLASTGSLAHITDWRLRVFCTAFLASSDPLVYRRLGVFLARIAILKQREVS